VKVLGAKIGECDARSGPGDGRAGCHVHGQHVAARHAGPTGQLPVDEQVVHAVRTGRGALVNRLGGSTSSSSAVARVRKTSRTPDGWASAMANCSSALRSSLCGQPVRQHPVLGALQLERAPQEVCCDGRGDPLRRPGRGGGARKGIMLTSQVSACRPMPDPHINFPALSVSMVSFGVTARNQNLLVDALSGRVASRIGCAGLVLGVRGGRDPPSTGTGHPRQRSQPRPHRHRHPGEIHAQGGRRADQEADGRQQPHAAPGHTRRSRRSRAFLAFDATYTTGTELVVDGGSSQL
jgi:hypothetical protein